MKLLMKRSREVQRADSWVEYFDPDTSAFWYFDTVGNWPRPECYTAPVYVEVLSIVPLTNLKTV